MNGMNLNREAREAASVPPITNVPASAAIPVAVESEASLLARGNQPGDSGAVRSRYAIIAMLWEGVLQIPVTPDQVSLCEAMSGIAHLRAQPSDHQAMVEAVAGVIRHQRVVEGD